MKTFTVVSVNLSERPGERKRPVPSIRLKAEHGVVGDAHAGSWHRQVSLLAEEDIEVMRQKGFELAYGDFAENITTRGIDLAALPIGARLTIGKAVLEVTQIGKECHAGCAIRDLTGDCIMPKRGIFARVSEGGEVSACTEGTW
jgi:MOSC domain-containing protein YiiM